MGVSSARRSWRLYDDVSSDLDGRNGIPVACSWSGGKDSCLALHRVMEAGARPVALVTMLDGTGARSRSHGLRSEVFEWHAAALGVPWMTASAEWSDYESAFVGLLRRAREAGAEAVVFGDIDLEPHREWEELVCARAGLRAVLPLWGESRRGLVEEFLASGFAARITTVRVAALPAEVLGARMTDEFVAMCEATGVDACGENGEYHSVVVGAPWFDRELVLEAGAIHEVGGCAGVDLRVVPERGAGCAVDERSSLDWGTI